MPRERFCWNRPWIVAAGLIVSLRKLIQARRASEGCATAFDDSLACASGWYSKLAIKAVATLLLTAHAGLLAYSASVHSPTLNEPDHLAAGISHWQFGRFELYRVNPPLVRTLAALPALAAGAKTDWAGFHEGPGARPVFSIGNAFVAANRGRTIWLMTLARWACIPLSLIGGVVCYLWAGRLYGRAAGLLALALWCFSPNILAHASLITPDLGATALGTLAAYLFWRWLQSPHWPRALAAGLALGLAELTKTSWIILFGLWPAIWLIWRLSRPRTTTSRKPSHDAPCPPPRNVVDTGLRERNDANPTTLWGGVGGASEPTNRINSTHAATPTAEHPSVGQTAAWLSQAAQLLLLLAAAIYVLNSGYGFEGTLTRLGDFEFVSRALVGPHGDDDASGPPSGNRFAESWVGAIPVPLPKNYVLGIDIQRSDFEHFGRPSYLRGEFRDRGWWYYYLYALAIKVPLATWLLVLAYYGSVDPRYVGIDYRLPPVRTNASDPAPALSPGWYAISVNFLRGYPFLSYDGNGGQQWLPEEGLSYFRRLRPVGMAGYSIYIYHITAELPCCSDW